ncbi:coiled-coil domain-containing protein 127-like [Centroberyx affinis]|uniref:coiled-coil domain-containing protein 127-like n=1 Tax=Centroberyx affinis TaxID=166261 RepID=UPI003A5BBC83
MEVKIKRNQVDLVQAELKKLEDLLVQRQHLFCSSRTPRSHRRLVETQILEEASAFELLIPDMKTGLEKIFREDRGCGSCISYLRTGDKRQNGEMMWDFLKEWKSQLDTQKH